jgi:hypothetical protein
MRTSSKYGDASFDATKYYGLRDYEQCTRGVLDAFVPRQHYIVLIEIVLWLKVASMTIKLIAVD